MFAKKRTWIGLAFIVVTFYFLFRNINPEKLWDAVTAIHLVWLLPALTVYFTGYLIRARRWMILLSPIKKCKFTSLFPTLTIGFMGNNLLPARAGEFIRAHLNGKKEGISRSASFATIVLERMFDGLTMIVLIWLALEFGHLPVRKETMPEAILHAITWSPYVFGAAFLTLFLLLIFKKTAVQVMNFFIRLAPDRFHETLTKLAHTFLDGLQILQNARESVLVLLASLAAWTCEFSAYYFLATGMGIAPSPLTYLSAALLMAVVNLGILIPNAPGGIGLFEFIGVALLMPFGLSKEEAVGFMFMVHFMVLVPMTLVGFYFSTRERLHLGKLEDDPREKP